MTVLQTTLSPNNVDIGTTVTLQAAATDSDQIQWQRKRVGGAWTNLGNPILTPRGIEPYGRFWKWKGVPTLLRGGTYKGEPNLYNQKYSNPEKGITINDSTDFLGEELTKISGAKGNYFRCTLVNWNAGEESVSDSVFPFSGSPGNFNLSSINQNWVDRLDALLYRCEELNIVVSLEMFDTWWCIKNYWADNSTNPTTPQPEMCWHPANVNSPSNYTYSSTGLTLDEQSNNDKFTYPARNNLTTNPLLIAQKLFVRTICDIVKRHNNALIQIQNESIESVTWDDYWKNYVRAQGVTSPITTMQDDWNLGTTGGTGNYALQTPGYDYGDQSQQFWEYFGTSNLDDNWNLLQQFRTYGAKPINAVKVYSRWNRVSGGVGSIKAVDFMFLSFMGGAAGIAFHPGGVDYPVGLGTTTRALNAMRAAGWLDENCDMSTMSPVSLTNSKWNGTRNGQQAFACTGPNNIAIYVNTNNDFRFNTTSLGSTMTMRWAKVDGNGTSGSGTTSTSSSKVIHNPFGNIQAILVMTKV